MKCLEEQLAHSRCSVKVSMFSSLCDSNLGPPKLPKDRMKEIVLCSALDEGEISWAELASFVWRSWNRTEGEKSWVWLAGSSRFTDVLPWTLETVTELHKAVMIRG